MVAMLRVGQLFAGALQAAAQHLLRLGAAVAQARLEHAERGRLDEDAHRVGQPNLQLLGSLHLDLEDQVEALARRLVHRGAARAVEVLLVDRVLEERAVLDHRAEARLVDEEVVDPVPLARARRARGVRDREAHLRVGVEHAAHDRALAHAGGARHHEGYAAPRAHGPSSSPSSPVPVSRSAIVSGCTAESTTWSESVMITERVLRPWVASTSLPRPPASSRSRRIGAAEEPTTAITRAATTTFP